MKVPDIQTIPYYRSATCVRVDKVNSASCGTSANSDVPPWHWNQSKVLHASNCSGNFFHQNQNYPWKNLQPVKLFHSCSCHLRGRPSSSETLDHVDIVRRSKKKLPDVPVAVQMMYNVNERGQPLDGTTGTEASTMSAGDTDLDDVCDDEDDDDPALAEFTQLATELESARKAVEKADLEDKFFDDDDSVDYVEEVSFRVRTILLIPRFLGRKAVSRVAFWRYCHCHERPFRLTLPLSSFSFSTFTLDR